MKKKYMTKAQALASFKEHDIPALNERYGKDDTTARRTAWNDYTDYLAKDGRISWNQCNTWTNPF